MQTLGLFNEGNPFPYLTSHDYNHLWMMRKGLSFENNYCNFIFFWHWNFSHIGIFPILEFFPSWKLSIIGNFQILEFFQHLIMTVLKVAIKYQSFPKRDYPKSGQPNPLKGNIPLSRGENGKYRLIVLMTCWIVTCWLLFFHF